MQSQTNTPVNETNIPSDGNVFATTDGSGNIKLIIPAKGFKGKGLLTIVIIGIWMLTILVWSGLLVMMKPIYVLYSLPFWAIGIHTLIKAIRILTIEQTILVDDSTVTLRMERGDKTEERIFNKNEVLVSFIEGSYYSYTGLNKRGQYPAFIVNNEAFGFAERATGREKKWLTDYLKAHI